MPLWLLLTVMSLTVYRCTRLIVRDTLPPVLWLRRHLVGGWRPERPGEDHDPTGPFQVIDGVTNWPVYRARWVPYWLAELWSCPWCVSGWIAGVVTAATDVWVGLPAPVLCGFAAWALGALLASREGA